MVLLRTAQALCLDEEGEKKELFYLTHIYFYV